MILEVEKLELFYGDAQALDGVSIGAAEGELVAIVGANGAGKSSLIRTIAGIETPRSGRIRFRDRDITANVLLSCDETASRRRAAFGQEQGILDDFLAVPGSSIYEGMRSGGLMYRIWTLRR